MAMNIYCKFEKASYNIFFVRAVMVKSLYTLRRRQQRRRRNEVKSIVSTGCYPMTAFISKLKMAELWFGCFEYFPCIQKWQYIQ